MSKYDPLLEELKQKREAVQFYKDEMNAMIKHVTDSPNYQVSKNGAEQAAARVAELEAQIRTEAVNEFNATENKNPHPLVTVKIFKEFRIMDSACVLLWVKNNLADALVFDEKKVKDYATKIGHVEGTAVVTEPRAQIATKL